MFSCRVADRHEKVIFDRIKYIYNLKSLIDKDTWSSFSRAEFDLPLIFYADSNCYVTNPNDKFLRQFNPVLVYKNKSLLIYKTSLLDSIPFHMETHISLGDYTPDYNYNSPFMHCSSPEITDKFVPDVHSTEMWATMVIHEYFHGFQFKHIQFQQFYAKHVNVSADTLKGLYNNNDWFKESVDRENELLLSALNATSKSEIKPSLIEFFKVREQRLLKSKELLKSDIRLIEKNYETMEGTARYIEYSLYEKFSSMQPDENLIKSDTLFKSYNYFNDYTISQDGWLYLSGSNYFYATGFNIARLLDKMKVDYKHRLFNEVVFLDDILHEQIFLPTPIK